MFKTITSTLVESRKNKNTSRFVKYFFLFFFFVAIFFMSNSSVFAATYYVRADGTVIAANKTNATNSNSASTSLNMAQFNLCTFSDNDTIYFSNKGGTFSVVPVLPSGGSGTETEITYAGVVGETVTVSIAKGVVLDTNSQSNIIVNNLTLKNTASDNTVYLITVAGGTNITLNNLSVDGHYYTSGLKVYGTASNVSVNTLVGTNLGSAMPVTVTDTASFITFENCNMSRGFYVGSNAHDITFKKNNSNSATGAYGSGFTISGSVYNVTFIENIAHDNAGAGFQEDTLANNITHTGDISYNNTTNGFHSLNNTHDITYNNCVAHNNGLYTLNSNGLGFAPHDAATNIVVKNSISYNNKNGGFGDVSTGTNYFYNSLSYQDGYIAGDTFVGSVGSQIVTVSTRYGPFYFVKTGGMVTAKNCIIYQGKPWSLRYSNLSYITLDYNDYYPLTSNNFYTTNGTNIYSWTTYNTTNGYELHSINDNPQFVNPGTDFHLLPSSPAINAGVGVGLSIDYAGTSVPQGSTPDIGAYEFLLPVQPSSLTQYKSDGITNIASGSYTNESTVLVNIEMSSSNSSDSLTPQVEIREIGTTFSNSATNVGITVSYSGTPVIGTVTVTGLTSGKTYHWQALTSNSAGQSAWVAKGSNPDFGVDTPTPTPIPTNSQSNISNSSSSSSSSASDCHDSSPVLISDLFQINTTSNNAKLFFTPIDTNQFYVSFSTKPNAEDYGELVTLAREGVQSHTIYLLKPNTTYYIKVRGQNDCATGNWSNIMAFTTPSSIKQKIFYKNSKLAVITNGIKSTVNNVSKIIPTKNTTNKTNTETSSPTVDIQTKVSPSPTPVAKSVDKKKTCILWWCW